VRLLEAHARPVSAVGGVVHRDPDASVGWALFLTDYGRYRDAEREGPTRALTDVNASYKRWALALVAEVWRDEFHEPAVNGALLRGGGSLWRAPAAVVRQTRMLPLGDALRDRYEYGRLFASGRVRGASVLRRALFAVLAPALPAVVVARAALGSLRSGDGVASLVRVLPVLIAVACAWSWGELVGYLTGTPRRRRPEPVATSGESA
jgi:hypothetical protein